MSTAHALDAAEETLALPFLKWAGGKRSLLDQIFPFVPAKLGTYFEPFVGGGALFFALRSQGRIKRAQLSDINERLVRTYRALQGTRTRDTVESVIAKLVRKKNDKAFFLRERARKIDALDDTDVAAWMIYLNKTCFNGLYRVNAKNEFNVPFGDYANPRICDARNLRACAFALGGDEAGPGDVVVPHSHFDIACSRAKKGDFVYFDPPYLPRMGSEFTSYDASSFGIEEHTQLRDLALALKRKGVHVLVSNSGADDVRALYGSREFTLVEVKGKRSVGASSNSRTHAPDLLIR